MSKNNNANVARLYLLGDDFFTNTLELVRQKARKLKYNTQENRKIINDYLHTIVDKPIEYDDFTIREISCKDESNTPDVINDNALVVDVHVMMKPKLETVELAYVIK